MHFAPWKIDMEQNFTEVFPDDFPLQMGDFEVQQVNFQGCTFHICFRQG